MSFVKLDCGMLDSTIWPDKPARDVFITALLMAKPKRVEQPTPGISIQSTEPSGFVVPPGHYGFVEAAGPGIVRRAQVDDDIGLEALERLSSPDNDSRTPLFEGRRMIRVSGGFVILNYQSYRDKDHTSRLRSQRYRERQRNGVSSRNHAVTPRSVTQAEAEAEAEVEESTLSGKPDVVVDFELKDSGKNRGYHKDSRSVLTFLNETAGRKFCEVDCNLRIISARLEEQGVDFDGIKAMILRQWEKSRGTQWEEYVQPKTLFAPKNFDGYYANRGQPIIREGQKPPGKSLIEKELERI